MASGGFRLIYLGGIGRSGSTLTERLLGQLAGVCAAGEVVHLWRRGVAGNERCGCGIPFLACPFWRAIGAAAFGGWSGVDIGRLTRLRAVLDRTRFVPLLARRSLPGLVRQNLDEYTDYYLRVYQAIAKVSGCATVVDSSKHASLAFCLSHRTDIDLRVIHVVRDSRAVAYSWSTPAHRPEAAAGTLMTAYSPARAAGQWNTQNGALELLGRGRIPVMLVRYEDLVSRVGPTLRAIAAFSGVAVGEPGLSFIGGDGTTRWAVLDRAHSAAGNPMRFRTGQIPIERDDRWRSAMPGPQRRMVTMLTLPLLRRYGYARRAE